MPPERQHNPPRIPPGSTPRTIPGTTARLAIRRHTDRCFHQVEEVVPEGLAADGMETGVRGYIIDGVMIDADDVAEAREIPNGGTGPACTDESAKR